MHNMCSFNAIPVLSLRLWLFVTNKFLRLHLISWCCRGVMKTASKYLRGSIVVLHWIVLGSISDCDELSTKLDKTLIHSSVIYRWQLVIILAALYQLLKSSFQQLIKWINVHKLCHKFFCREFGQINMASVSDQKS
mgnify:CR=1 FL=1